MLKAVLLLLFSIFIDFIIAIQEINTILILLIVTFFILNIIISM